MKVYTQKESYNQGFGKFIRISGKKPHLKHFRQRLRDDSNEFLSFITRKNNQKYYLYLITGKDLKKFIDVMHDISCFFKFRKHPEKYLSKEPKNYSLKEAKKRYNETQKI